MADLIDREKAIATAVTAAIGWHRLANPQYSIAYCIGEAMRALPSTLPEKVQLSKEDATFDLIKRESVRLGKIPYDEDLTDYEKGWNDALDAVADNAPSAQPEPERKEVWKGLDF